MSNELIDRLAVTAQRFKISRQFRQSMGYSGNFENPKTYQEKMQFRKLYGNHDFYALVADKYRAREYVASRIGAEHLVPLLGVYDRLEASVFDTLPSQFIIKANHGCKWHQVVKDKSKLDVARTVARFNKYCRETYGWVSGERHYNFIPPRIVIEALLEDDHGGLPWDYGFFCYNGPQGFDFNLGLSSPSGKSAAFYKDWEVIESKIPEEELALHAKPANFDTMVRIAKALSADFDFVRVDLYSVGGKVYFGELTCTPHGGYGPIKNPLRQKMRDEMWHLDATNPRLYTSRRPLFIL